MRKLRLIGPAPRAPALGTLRALALGTLGVLAIAAGPRTLRAQQPAPRVVASAFLPAHHWADDALRRLDALGLLPRGFDAATHTRTRREVALLFTDARDSAAALHRPDLAALAGDYLQRFGEEFPGAVRAVGAVGGAGPARAGEGSAGNAGSAPARPVVALTSASLNAGYSASAGVLAIGTNLQTSPVADVASGTASGELSVRVGRHLAGSITPAVDDGGATIVAGYAMATLGPVGLWAGRRDVGFGPGEDGGIVLSPTSFTGGGIALVRPWTAPGVLRHLGPLNFESFLSRIRNGDPGVGLGITDPLIWGNHLSFSPAAGLVIGATRVFLMAGRNNEPATLGHFVDMLLGRYGEWHAETASIDARWRTPLRIIPLTAYIEWGMETASGAFFRVPGRVIGLEVAALPGVPWLGLALERTHFHGPVIGVGPWYSNWQFQGNWADAGQPLGHPLGGTGQEWALHVSADPFGARLRLRALAFTRDRRFENLYAGARPGRSHGGWVRAGWRIGGHLDVEADGYLEQGSGWRETRLAAVARWLIAPRLTP